MFSINWFTAIVLYIIVWWTVLFTILPIGVTPVAEPDEVTGWRGAPARPRIGRKVLWTTLAATLVWAVIMAVVLSGWISFRTGWLALPED